MANKKGEVIYEIRGDDSNLEADLDAANKKVEESVTQGGEKLKSIAAGSAKAIGAGMLAAGTAAAAAGKMAVDSANQMDQAMNQFMATTGKGADEADRYQDVLEKIYANNYGEDFNDIAESMAAVNKQLGDMSDDKLQEVTESAFALRDTFGYEIPETTRAAKAMMDNFGLSGEKAMGLIAAGAQNGLDYSGEMIDSINEYSVQFAKLGFDADEMFKIFQQGADNGAFNLDKVGDAIKEFSIRAMDGSDSTKQAFSDLGFEDLTEEFAAGGDRARDAFDTILYELSGMQDKVKQNEIGVALFGTMWEDLGVEAVEALAEIQDGAYDTADAMNQIKEVKYDDLGSMLEGLKRSLELLLIPLGEELIPILDELIQAVMPMIEEALPPIADAVGHLIKEMAPLISSLMPLLIELVVMLLDVMMPLIEAFFDISEPILMLIAEALGPLVEALMPIIEIISAVLIPVLKLLMEAFGEVMQGIISEATTQLGNLKKLFDELIDFIKNVFTGNWEAAWENIKNIFKTIAESLSGIFKVPINAIIDLINGFIKGLNKIEIPDWVPGVGGKGFHIDMIPRLKRGMSFVPSDYFPAYLDYGERVLTQEENVRFNAMGGLAGMEVALSNGNGGLGEKLIIEKGSITGAVQMDGQTVGTLIAPIVDVEIENARRESER